MKRGVLYGIAGNGGMRRGLFGLVAAVATALLIYFAFEVRTQMQRLGEAASDNVQWVFSRGEVEAVALQTAALRASEQAEPDLDALRRSFDIFYSRLQTLEESNAMDPLRSDPRFTDAVERLSALVDEMLPLIDGPDATLLAHLPKLVQQTQDAQVAMRAVSLNGIALYAQASDARRAEVAQTLQRIGLVTAVLFFLLLVMAYTQLRLLQRQEADARDLREARDVARAGERSKAHMLAVMSHEMRTPLNGVVGALELIDATALPSETRNALRMARSAADQLIGHVDDVLDISRLDAGAFRRTARPFDLVSVMRSVIDSQNAAAQAQGNHLTMRPPHPDLHQCHGDAGRIQQILLNLVGNAIKFTKGGRITLEADCRNGLETVELRVSDTGIGISAQDLLRIFDDFVTLDTGYDRTNGGTGLGLGIVKRLAKALGGEVGAESVPGEGSLFWVRLPLQKQGEQASEANANHDPTSLPGLRILVVEDHASNRLILRRLLEKMGHSVIEAANGAEGLEAAKRFDPDVILMDISMPVMDGLSAARALRTETGPASSIPIIATTAHALPEERAAFTGAGIQGVLTKPLTSAAVRTVLNDVMNGLPQGALPAKREPCGELLDSDQIDTLRNIMSATRLERSLKDFRDEMSEFCASVDPATPNARETHRMAGSAALFGAASLAEHLRSMCESAKRQNTVTWQKQASALVPLWRRTSKAMARIEMTKLKKIARGQD